LSPDLNKKIELLKVELGPDCEEDKLIQLGKEEEEYAFLLEGEVEFNFEDKRVQLKEGDCILLNRSLLKKIKNLHKKSSSILLAVSH